MAETVHGWVFGGVWTGEEDEEAGVVEEAAHELEMGKGTRRDLHIPDTRDRRVNSRDGWCIAVVQCMNQPCVEEHLCLVYVRQHA